LRAVEERWQSKAQEWDRDRRKLTEEIKHLRERMEVLRNMNINLQKLGNIQKKKADQTDALVKRCIELEETNQKLVNIIASSS
jgi:hypothetical protein